MAHYSKLFSKVPVEVQNVSGFDLSHENLFTAKCGTLVPAFVYDCIPNTKLSLGVSAEIQLPPMATDFYGKVDAVYEAFFVPYRLLYGGWQELITHPVNNAVYPTGQPDSTKAKYLPYFNIPFESAKAGSLADYLGVKLSSNANLTLVPIYNPFRFLAYGKIYDDWYRNSFVQVPLFRRAVSSSVGTYTGASAMPFSTFPGDSPQLISTTLNDGTQLYDLRQRNWAKDYFTSATPLPQAGSQSTLELSIQGPEDTGAGYQSSISWGELSAMNSLQRWMQRNNLAGYRYSDQILARFGVLPPDSIMDRAIYLGRKIIPVYTKSVYQQGASEQETTNPFSSIGTKFGSPVGVGNGSLIDKFHAKEHGVFMVLFSLVPRAYYSTGVDRVLYQNTMADFPDPDFAHLGDQSVYDSELTGIFTFGGENGTFAYVQKDAHYKYKDDQVHGLLRDGNSLSSFALQRSFNSIPVLGSSFLEIPTNFMDQVTAVGNSVSNYGCWVDSYFNCKVSMPLPAYSIPTLTDPKDVHTVMVDKGGRTL